MSDLTINKKKMATTLKMKAMGLLQKPKIANIPNEIKELTVSIPKINSTEVLVKIITSTIHVDDIAVAQGTAIGRFYGPKEVSEKKPYIMGTNFSGVIEAIGKQVSQFKIGDEVIGIPNVAGEHGSWATYRCLDERNIRIKPKALSHQEAVSMIVAGCVAYGMLVSSKVKKGDHCLVLGSSGGIGSVITQMLKSKGAIVIGLCSTRNIEMVKANGVDYVIDYTKDNFVKKLTSQNKKINLVFDSVGGKELENIAIKVLHKKGRFLTVCGPEKYIGSKKLSWRKVIHMLWYIMYRSILSKIIGPRYIFSAKPPSTTINDMHAFVIKNNIKVPVDRIIPLEIKKLKEALKHLSAHKASGRIIIDMTK
ncbi:NAD(P)-dependent alcohol dehydrogenase [Maribacter vaceletii]|nr:NAD(P)-dependent alcohol dehydrogenase [Maribacter vaceletii]